jgi:hypothetical protein
MERIYSASIMLSIAIWYCRITLENIDDESMKLYDRNYLENCLRKSGYFQKIIFYFQIEESALIFILSNGFLLTVCCTELNA